MQRLRSGFGWGGGVKGEVKWVLILNVSDIPF